MVTPKNNCRVYFQGFNLDWSSGREEYHLWVSPEDAESLGPSDGGPALVENVVGRARVSITVAGDIRQWAVCLIDGHGFATTIRGSRPTARPTP